MLGPISMARTCRIVSVASSIVSHRIGWYGIVSYGVVWHSIGRLDESSWYSIGRLDETSGSSPRVRSDAVDVNNFHRAGTMVPVNILFIGIAAETAYFTYFLGEC